MKCISFGYDSSSTLWISLAHVRWGDCELRFDLGCFSLKQPSLTANETPGTRIPNCSVMIIGRPNLENEVYFLFKIHLSHEIKF